MTSGRKDRHVDETAISLDHPGKVRNCIVVNTCQECVVTPRGSTISWVVIAVAVVVIVLTGGLAGTALFAGRAATAADILDATSALVVEQLDRHFQQERHQLVRQS